MSNFRRLAALGLPVLVAGALVGGPAAASNQPVIVDQHEAFAGNAASVGFELSALGNGLTLGDTVAAADVTMTAAATGTGVLRPLADQTVVKAAVDKTPESLDDPAKACGTPDLSALAGLGLTAGLACGDALAGTINGLPVAEASAAVADVTVSAASLLNTLGLQDTLADTTTTVFDTLDELLGIDETQLGDEIQTVEDLLGSVIETDTLRVAVGDADSKVVTTADNVVSSGYAAGAVIEILPQGVIDEAQPLNLDARRPVATIEIGAASATASFTRGTTGSVAEFDPALVRVTLDRTVAAALLLGDGTQDYVVEVAPDTDLTILAGTPLESRIVAASGRTYDVANGVGAESDAVRLELVKGLQGGVVLALASAKAEITGVPELTRVESVPPQVPVELPRTGGTPLMPVAGVALLGLAVGLRRLATRS